MTKHTRNITYVQWQSLSTHLKKNLSASCWEPIIYVHFYKWQCTTAFTHNRLHVVIDLSLLPTMWIYMHSQPQAVLCVKKLQPGDNLINQLSVISTVKHQCLRQIAFLSSSLGPKNGGICLIIQMLLYSVLAFPASKVINVCVAKSVWVVCACLRLISSPWNSALCV